MEHKSCYNSVINHTTIGHKLPQTSNYSANRHTSLCCFWSLACTWICSHCPNSTALLCLWAFGPVVVIGCYRSADLFLMSRLTRLHWLHSPRRQHANQVPHLPAAGRCPAPAVDPKFHLNAFRRPSTLLQTVLAQTFPKPLSSLAKRCRSLLRRCCRPSKSLLKSASWRPDVLGKGFVHGRSSTGSVFPSSCSTGHKVSCQNTALPNSSKVFSEILYLGGNTRDPSREGRLRLHSMESNNGIHPGTLINWVLWQQGTGNKRKQYLRVAGMGWCGKAWNQKIKENEFNQISQWFAHVFSNDFRSVNVFPLTSSNCRRRDASSSQKRSSILWVASDFPTDFGNVRWLLFRLIQLPLQGLSLLLSDRLQQCSNTLHHALSYREQMSAVHWSLLSPKPSSDPCCHFQTFAQHSPASAEEIQSPQVHWSPPLKPAFNLLNFDEFCTKMHKCQGVIFVEETSVSQAPHHAVWLDPRRLWGHLCLKTSAGVAAGILLNWDVIILRQLRIVSA